MARERYRVSELARLCGVNPRTVDFYTNAGLLVPVQRSAGGHRFYDAEAVGHLRLIKALRAQGMSLDTIRARLAGAEGETQTLAHITQLQTEVQRLDSEIVALTPHLAAADAAQRRVLRAALVTAASAALALSHDLMELLNQIGIGTF